MSEIKPYRFAIVTKDSPQWVPVAQELADVQVQVMGNSGQIGVCCLTLRAHLMWQGNSLVPVRTSEHNSAAIVGADSSNDVLLMSTLLKKVEHFLASVTFRGHAFVIQAAPTLQESVVYRQNGFVFGPEGDVMVKSVSDKKRVFFTYKYS